MISLLVHIKNLAIKKFAHPSVRLVSNYVICVFSHLFTLDCKSSFQRLLQFPPLVLICGLGSYSVYGFQNHDHAVDTAR
jgi:hypothetical protein